MEDSWVSNEIVGVKGRVGEKEKQVYNQEYFNKATYKPNWDVPNKTIGSMHKMLE